MAATPPLPPSQGLMQPYLPPELASTCDLRNTLNQSGYHHLLGKILIVGMQHPDDKKKEVHEWYERQMVQLTNEYRMLAVKIDEQHYPGQFPIPKTTSAEYKRARKFVSGVAG